MALVVKRNVKPKAVPGLKKKGYKKAGAKYGPRTYVLKKGAPAKPKPAPGPYDQYKGTPYEGYFERRDQEQQQHQNWVSGLMPQVAQGLAAITGVNPASPGYNPTIQQQYLANVQGSVGNALNASAAATPNMVASSTPGGVVAAPNAYQGAAMQQFAAQSGGAAILNAQAQAAMNTVQPNIYAQAAYSKIADYAAGLPKVYADRKADEMIKANQFIAEANETARHNRVQEAISAQNAQTNAAIQFGRLGLDTSKLGQDVTESAADRASRERQNAADNATDVQIAGIRSSSSGGSGGGSSGPSASRGQYPPNKLRKEGFRPLAKGAGPKWRKIAVRATDGSLWIKPGRGGSSSSKVSPRSTVTDLQSELVRLYKPGGSGGWEERYTNDPEGAGVQIARWIRENKPAFIKGSNAGRKVDMAKLRAVINRIGGRPAAEALRILVKGYMTSDGRWK